MKETKIRKVLKPKKNLMAAFAGESEARNKYTYFASKAKKEGYEQIAALFLKTADNEKEHAKLWFKELNGIGDTAENLLAAALRVRTTSGQICTTALPRLLTRRASTNLPSASVWSPPLKSTMRSANRALLRNVETAQVFAKSEVKVWECRNCGHIVVGEKAPEVCPACNHPQSYFEIHRGKLLKKEKENHHGAEVLYLQALR